MKINTSDFLVDNKILEANENEIIYDLPRQKIQETWDKLSAFYAQKSLNENESEIVENEFYLDLANSRVENETVITTHDLISKNIIRKYDCKEPKELKSNIKKYILDEVLSILRKGLNELKANVEEEKEFTKEVIEVNNEIQIFENSVHIATDQLKYIDFDEFLKIKQEKHTIGLFCTIKMNNIELKGFHSIANHSSIPDCKSLVQTYSKNGIYICLENTFSELANDAVTSFIDEIYCGKKIEDLVSYLPVLFSRFFLDQLTFKSHKRTIVQSNSKKLIDGLSSTFYCLTEDLIFKITREEYDFRIFCNGKLVIIKNI